MQLPMPDKPQQLKKEQLDALACQCAHCTTPDRFQLLERQHIDDTAELARLRAHNEWLDSELTKARVGTGKLINETVPRLQAELVQANKAIGDLHEWAGSLERTVMNRDATIAQLKAGPEWDL